VYRVGTTNASPEPVRKGRTLKVTSSVTLRGPDGRYRKVPAGVAFTVQFRATGAKRWATVASSTTTTGRATARVVASRSGTWRVVVGTKAARGDSVRVRR
jgi:hypothetical protein